MSKQCTKPKGKQDDSWFKDKVMLVQAQANGQILHEEELAFLADPGILKVALMANLSHYGSDTLAEVHNLDNVNNDMTNQGVQNSVNSSYPTPSNSPTKVEVPKELPKVGMTYKQLYDSIKPTRVRSKEQCDALINQVNQKSMELSDLNVSLQEKDLVITALKDDIRKLKGKALVDDVVTSHYIAPKMLKVDVEPLAPKLLNNRTSHSDYLRHTQEQAAILKKVVEQGKS
nr:hypothetical protein [Tanacetum cinerariifolium]